MSGRIFVSGAAGKVGRAVVEKLIAKGEPVRGGFRNPAAATAPRELHKVKFDFTDFASVESALDGVSGAFLISPPLDPDAPAKLTPFIKEAKKHNIHVVFISAFGANMNADGALAKVEKLLHDTAVTYTILRPNFFMDNFTEGWIAPSIKQQNSLFIPAGDGKTSFIAAHDIAAAVVSAFNRKLVGKTYDLTGSEALDHTEVAQLISTATGRTISYVDIPESALIEGAKAQGMPDGMIAYLADLYKAVRGGYCAAITHDLEDLINDQPIRFSTFAKAHKADW